MLSKAPCAVCETISIFSRRRFWHHLVLMNGSLCAGEWDAVNQTTSTDTSIEIGSDGEDANDEAEVYPALSIQFKQVPDIKRSLMHATHVQLSPFRPKRNIKVRICNSK